MQLPEICEALLKGLEEYDAAILPLGLYASDELVEGKTIKPRQMEWNNALVPAIKSLGGQAALSQTRSNFYYEAAIQLPNLGQTRLGVIRYSQIKVRKYGSRYQVDKHEDRSERWGRMDLSGRISNLWKHSDNFSDNCRMLILIGFDKAPEPMRRELQDLESTLHWSEKNVVYQTRFWQDKAERGFGVRLSAWTRSIAD